MISAIPTGGDLLLLPLIATLPVMTSIQVWQLLASSPRRVPRPVSMHSPSVKRLLKALNIHPLTSTFSIRFTAGDLPELTATRLISRDEVDHITDWINGDRIQTVELVGHLHPEVEVVQ
jgi:hypothetical protein